MVEEGEQLLQLNQGHYNQLHPDSCQRVIPVSPTGYPSVSHFMAYTVQSSLFRVGIAKRGFLDANLYRIAEDGGHIISPKQLKREAPEAISQSSQSLQIYQEESCCSCLQLNDLNLRSENGVINDGIFVLLSTTHVIVYNRQPWSCHFPLDRHNELTHRMLNAILLTEKNSVWVRVP